MGDPLRSAPIRVVLVMSIWQLRWAYVFRLGPTLGLGRVQILGVLGLHRPDYVLNIQFEHIFGNIIKIELLEGVLLEYEVSQVQQPPSTHNRE